MDDSLLSPVTVEVAHAPSLRADLVAGPIGPAVAQVNVAPARKRQGNVVVQGGNPAAPRRDGPRSGRQRCCAISAGGGEGRQGRRPQEEKDFGYKEAASFIRSLRPRKRCPGDAAPLASEVFDEMAGRYASSVMAIFFAFRHFAIARDLLLFTIAVVRTMQLPSS
jgi:hypothetical protein